MNLPAGWSEAITTSPLLLACLILVGASLVVLFLAPFFFNLAKKAKFPKRLDFTHRKALNKKWLVAFIVLLGLLAFGLGVYQFYFAPSSKPVAKNPQVEKEKVGPRGDFAISLTRKGDKVILNWDKGIAVSQILLVNLGKDTSARDNLLVWGISNVNNGPVNIDPAVYEQMLKNPALIKPVQPKIISPPYELLVKPDGFYYDQTISSDLAKFKLQKKTRYAAQLKGAKGEQIEIAGYVFDY